MRRRRLLSTLAAGGVLATAGCQRLRGSSPDADPAVPADVREWARTADPRGPVRATGRPVSLDRTVTDEPGYESDGIEYDPEERTVRYVAVTQDGEPVRYDTWSFEEWGRLKGTTRAARRAGEVAADRLEVAALTASQRGPPEGAGSTGPVAVVSTVKSLDRDGEVLDWPVVTFPDLRAAAPRSVDLTLRLEGDTFSRTVPVYARYLVRQLA